MRNTGFACDRVPSDPSPLDVQNARGSPYNPGCVFRVRVQLPCIHIALNVREFEQAPECQARDRLTQAAALLNGEAPRLTVAFEAFQSSQI